ncbi:MAG: hypothetical protein ACUVRS_07335 [Armatimonadota bacterium]
MKAALLLLGIVFLGLVLAVVVHFVPVVHGEAPQHVRLRENIVFVDINVLVPLHPAFETLQNLREFPTHPTTSTTALSCKLESLKLQTLIKRPEMNRTDLVAGVARTAVAEFSRFESTKREALNLRLQHLRTTAEKSLIPKLSADIREIERDAAQKERQVLANFAGRKLEMALQISALRSGVERYRSTLSPHADTQKDNSLTKLEAMLEKAVNENQLLEDTLAAQTSLIRSEANEKIRKLRTQKQNEVAAQLAEREVVEKALIESVVSEAREEVFSWLVMPEDSWYSELPYVEADSRITKPRAIPKQAAATAKAEQAIRTRTKALIAHLARTLEKQIKADVARAVRQHAARSGVRVTFKKSSQVPNATEQFSRLLRQECKIYWHPALACATRMM